MLKITRVIAWKDPEITQITDIQRSKHLDSSGYLVKQDTSIEQYNLNRGYEFEYNVVNFQNY